MQFQNYNILNSVLGKISSTLGFVNKLLPIYNEIKPIINDGKKIMAYFNNNLNSISLKKNNGIDTKKESNDFTSIDSNLTFFQ